MRIQFCKHMDILCSLMAGGAVLLAYHVYVAVSNIFILITALLVCSITLIILRQRPVVSRGLDLHKPQAHQESVSQPESTLRPIRLRPIIVKPITLSLLIEKKSRQVILAECDKSFVDVLLSFLLLPLGKVIRLADKQSQIGSMDKLYKSVEALSSDRFWTRACKNMLLEPRSAYGLQCSGLAVRIDRTDYDKFYTCSGTPCLCLSPSRGLGYASLVKYSICGCGREMDRKFWLNADRSTDCARGFVPWVERFIVSDDLQVTPMEINVVHSLLERRGIIDNNEVLVKNVNIGLEEVLQLLYRSVVSKTPLTDVFQPNAANKVEDQSRNARQAYHQKLTRYDFGSREMNVNLWYSKSAKKVVCVEAGEDFIDFLFSLLTFPLGSIINLLQKRSSSLGSIENLYRSVVVLYERDKVSHQNTMMLLYPKLERMFSCENQLLDLEEDASAPTFVNFKRSSLRIVNPKNPAFFPVTGGGGFVRQQGYFLVTDSLLVEPLSVVSGIQKLDIPFPDLKDLKISVGRVEALDLLQAAMTSKSSVLTRVFWPQVLCQGGYKYRS